MHRRGFKGRLHALDEERFLDGFLLQELEQAGTPGRIAFDGVDAIVSVETIGTRAGLAVWRREEWERYPLLHFD